MSVRVTEDKIIKPTDMSLQVCHCGWSKVTSYQGLRTHQGKKGCTPRGERIPYSAHLKFPQLTHSISPIQIIKAPDVSWQVCHCGWSKETTYQGLRTHQGKNGCTPRGERIPNSAHLKVPQLTYSASPIQIIKAPDVSWQVCHCGWSKETTYQGLRTHQGKNGCSPRAERIPNYAHLKVPQPTYSTSRIQIAEPSMDMFTLSAKLEAERNIRKNLGKKSHQKESTPNNSPPIKRRYFSSTLQPPSMYSAASLFGNQTSPVITDVNMEETSQTMFQTQTHVFRTDTRARRELDFSAGAQQPPSMFSATSYFGNQTSPAITEVNMEEPSETMFQTPTHVSWTHTGARRGLDLSTPRQQNGFSNYSMPTVPPVAPHTVPRMVPPVTHQTVPPMVPPTVPPLTPRTVPPRVPPVTQQTVPPIVPPTVAAAREAEVQQMIQTFTDNLQITSNSDRDTGALDTTSAAQIIKPTSMSLQVCPCGWSKVTTNKGLQIHQGKKECKRRGERIPNNAQLKAPQVTDSTSPIQVAAKPEGEQNIRKKLKRKSLQRESSPKNSTPIKAEPLQTSATPILGNQTNPSITKVKVEETNQTLFQTPTRALGSDTRARRALDFSTGAKQVENRTNATNTAQELSKKERDEQKLAKAKQDKIRADLQLRIQMIEQKMAEIESSEKACKGSLDAEWVEINDVFSAVQKVVDEARLKALRPLEERRKRVKRETQDLVQKLQKEIDKLKKTIDELDQNQDPGVSHLLEPQSWERETLDTSFSFSTLRATTSKMIQEIQEKVEKLSSTELKRTSKLADKFKAVLLTAIIIIIILALAHEDKKVPSNKELSQMRTNTKAYEAFTEQHIISESFDRNSLEEWASYLEGKYLCGRTPTQSFIDASAADVKKICSSSGWLVEDAPVLQSDFCMSGSTMTVYQVESDTRCNVLGAIRSDHYVIVRCSNLEGLYLPIHYEAYRNQMPAQKHCTPPRIDQSIKTDL